MGSEMCIRDSHQLLPNSFGALLVLRVEKSVDVACVLSYGACHRGPIALGEFRADDCKKLLQACVLIHGLIFALSTCGYKIPLGIFL